MPEEGPGQYALSAWAMTYSKDMITWDWCVKDSIIDDHLLTS